MGKYANTASSLTGTKTGCTISALAEDSDDLVAIREKMSDPQIGATAIARWLNSGISERIVRYHRDVECKGCCRG